MTAEAPLHGTEHVPHVPGMTFLGSHKGADLYFIPNTLGFHAITMVDGPADWQWESAPVWRIRKGDMYYREEMPYGWGLKTARELGLLA